MKVRKGKNKGNYSEENVKGEQAERSPTGVVNKQDRNSPQYENFLGFSLTFTNQ